jgi:hypothetical protein
MLTKIDDVTRQLSLEFGTPRDTKRVTAQKKTIRKEADDGDEQVDDF